MSWKNILKGVTRINKRRFDYLLSQLAGKGDPRKYYSPKLRTTYLSTISPRANFEESLSFAKELLEEATRVYNQKLDYSTFEGVHKYIAIENRPAYNRVLNAAKSMWMESDFTFKPYAEHGGMYLSSDNRQETNLSRYGQMGYDDTDEKEIMETIVHESAHRASDIINDNGFRHNPFFEEYLAYLAQYPKKKQTIERVHQFVRHPSVKRFVESEEGKEFKPIYDEMYVAGMGLREPKGLPKLAEAYREYWDGADEEEIKDILSEWAEESPNVSYA